MDRFSINDIEQLTGIKAHTLRIWEQRYQFLPAKRIDGGHRFYDGEDLKMLLKIASLCNNGFRISSILKMDADEMQLMEKPEKGNSLQETYQQPLLEAIHTFDEDGFNKIIHPLILHLGMEKCMLELIYPLLIHIGRRWLTNRMIPAQEHFCSSLIIKKLLLAIDGVDQPKHANPKSVLLFTPVGETHEIPLLFMQYLLKKSGHSTIYFGTATPVSILLEYCEVHRPSHLFMHVITHLGAGDFNHFLNELTRSVCGVKLILSGSFFQNNQPITDAPFKVLKDINEMIQFAKS